MEEVQEDVAEEVAEEEKPGQCRRQEATTPVPVCPSQGGSRHSSVLPFGRVLGSAVDGWMHTPCPGLPPNINVSS